MTSIAYSRHSAFGIVTEVIAQAMSLKSTTASPRRAQTGPRPACPLYGSKSVQLAKTAKPAPAVPALGFFVEEKSLRILAANNLQSCPPRNITPLGTCLLSTTRNIK